MRLLIFIFSFILFAFSYSTRNVKEYPQDYFRSPVNHPILLAGTFGELRPNHFHAGIDIKAAGGKIGESLFAVAEGTVSRIKVASGGYGNVLYIDHPNGYTSVYAHLYRFTPEIADFVKQQQYERNAFELDLYPPTGMFNFAKGEIIGKLGLSGRSYGPHLHFEIRDTQTEKPINPLLFGIDIKDNIAPKLHQLKIYNLNDKRETLRTKTYDLQKFGKNKYKIKGDTLVMGAWRVGFGLKAYDHMEGAPNWNGIYTMDMYNDEDLWFNFTMETFAFDETRYINAHLDYEEQVSKKSYFNRCYELPGNQLKSIYKEKTAHGVVELNKSRAKKINMVVTDVDGNAAELEFWVKRGEVKQPESTTFNYKLPFNEPNIIDNGSIYLYFPEGAFYENLYMNYSASADNSSDIFSPVHHIHNYKTPVHTYYDIGIKPTHIPAGKKDKMFIAYCDKDNNITHCGGVWENGMLKAKVRDMGEFYIMTDETPPTITPSNFKSNMRGYNVMSFKIKDNYGTARNLEGLKYSATIDGQWVLMEYDAKNDKISHRFEKDLPRGEHLLRLSLTDESGNETVLEKTFTR